MVVVIACMAQQVINVETLLDSPPHFLTWFSPLIAGHAGLAHDNAAGSPPGASVIQAGATRHGDLLAGDTGHR